MVRDRGGEASQQNNYNNMVNHKKQYSAPRVELLHLGQGLNILLELSMDSKLVYDYDEDSSTVIDFGEDD